MAHVQPHVCTHGKLHARTRRRGQTCIEIEPRQHISYCNILVWQHISYRNILVIASERRHALRLSYGVCLDMCSGIYLDMCLDMLRQVRGYVVGHVLGHVFGHVLRHMFRHVCIVHVFRHAFRNLFGLNKVQWQPALDSIGVPIHMSLGGLGAGDLFSRCA